MGKSSSSTSSTQKTTPYAPVSGTLEQGGNIMSGYLSNPNSTAVYQGPRVADLSGDTQAGQQMLRDSTGANTSQNYLTSLLNSSANIADNPQVQAMQDAIRRQVQATTNATFSSSGTVGGTQNQNVLAKGLADGLAQPLFQAWQTDQANKLTAAQALPGVGQQIISNQLGAGQITDSYNQNKINADMQKFEDERTAPIKAWSEVAPIATQMGQAFGTTTGQSKTKQNQSLGSQLLGGALTAGGLLSGVPGLSSTLGGMFGATTPNVALQPWNYTITK